VRLSACFTSTVTSKILRSQGPYIRVECIRQGRGGKFVPVTTQGILCGRDLSAGKSMGFLLLQLPRALFATASNSSRDISEQVSFEAASFVTKIIKLISNRNTIT
jgi:hypothetical protein